MKINNLLRSYYRRHYKRMLPYERMDMFIEKGLQVPHEFFPIFKMFRVNPLRFMGGGKVDNSSEGKLYSKFFDKHPEVFDTVSFSSLEPETHSVNQQSLATKFVNKQKRYMSEGFSEIKAFELVENDFAEVLQQEKYERSLFEGVASSNRSKSLMSFYEQEAEFESKQKVARMERELPQYKRYQADLESRYENLLNQTDEIIDNDDRKQLDYKTYEPATCK